MMSPDPNHDPKPSSYKDPFYVGYLPAPEPHRKFVSRLVTLMAIWLISVSIIMVLTMRSPGHAVWDISNEKQWTGTLLEHPYPMLLPDEENQTAPLLVVNMGKFGAHDRLANAFNHRVTLRGYELRREGRTLIELASSDDAIAILAPADPSTRTAQPVSITKEIQLVGEIIDGKCYLGAMKPGDGFGHRSCAALCLRGGLPPMFVAESDAGKVLYPLLVVDGSSTLDESVLQNVARRVRITASISTFANLPVLTTSAANIEVVDNPLGLSARSAPNP